MARSELTAADGAMLWALSALPYFDATTIQGRLMEFSYVLAPIEPVFLKRSGYMSKGTMARLRKWFDKVEGRAIDGLVLRRDRLGWCTVQLVGDSGR